MRVYTWAKHESQYEGQEKKEEDGIKLRGIKCMIIANGKSYHFFEEFHWFPKDIAFFVRKGHFPTNELEHRGFS